MRTLALLLLTGCPDPSDTGSKTHGGGRDSAGDSGDSGDTGTPENTAPSAPVVAITPSAPSAGVDLTVTVLTESVDAENDAVTYTYAWSLDGAPRTDLTGATVGADQTEDGQTWAVAVTPNDGQLDGEPGTSTVTVGNLPPSAPTVHIDPTAPADGDTLTLVFDTEAIDPNGDALTQTITWYVDGSRNGSWDDALGVDGRYVDAGEVYLAVVTVTDGLSDPVTVDATVTVANEPPVIRGLEISPSDPNDNDELSAVVSARDPEGGSLAYTYTWYRDGVVAADVGDTTTVPASATTVGETWGLTVTVSDGAADVTESAADVTIGEPDRAMLRNTLVAVVPADGATASGSWALTLMTSGASFGASDCDIEWAMTATDYDRICPYCDWSFAADYTISTADIRTSGYYCSTFYGPGRGGIEGSRRSPDLSADMAVASYAYGSGGYELTIYAYGPSGGYGYSGYGYTRMNYYGVTATDDTAGNTTIEAYSYIYVAY